MKTSLKTFAFAFIFAAAFVAQAFAHDGETKGAAHFGTGIYASKNGDIHIGVDKYQKEKAVVLVTDFAGKVIYKEILGKDVSKFRKTLKISDLPLGLYTIEVTCCNGANKLAKTFDVGEKRIERTITLK